MNNFVVDENNEVEMLERVKIPVILNTLSFYAGKYYRYSGYKNLLVDEWQQIALNDGIEYVNLLDIKRWFEKKVKSKKDLLKPNGFEQRILDNLNQIPEERLRNIILTDFSLTDSGIKENLNNGTNVYRFYDLKNKYVYYVDNSSMPGEFSGGVINAICGQGKNKPENKALYSGLDNQDFLSFACKMYFFRKYMNTDLSDEGAKKIFYVGYSFGGHKVLCSIFFEAIRLGKQFDFSKYFCVSINGLGLADKTINFFKEQLGDIFDKVAARILNIAGSSDMVYPYTKNPFGQEIFFDSERKKGIFGHDITSLDLNKKIDKNKLGFKYELFKQVHLYFDKHKSNYKLCYTVLVIIERFKKIKYDINGNKTKIGVFYSIYGTIVFFNLATKAFFLVSFRATLRWTKKRFSKSKNKKGNKQIKDTNETPTYEENIDKSSSEQNKDPGNKTDLENKDKNKITSEQVSVENNLSNSSNEKPLSKIQDINDNLSNPDSLENPGQENHPLR